MLFKASCKSIIFHGKKPMLWKKLKNIRDLKADYQPFVAHLWEYAGKNGVFTEYTGKKRRPIAENTIFNPHLNQEHHENTDCRNRLRWIGNRHVLC